jgi:hypothetical protein
MGPAGVAEAIWEVFVQWGCLTRWLRSRLASNEQGRRRVRVGGGSKLDVGVLVVERNFTKFFGECACGNFGKCHEPSLQARGHGEVALERPSASAMQTQEPRTKVSPRLRVLTPKIGTGKGLTCGTSLVAKCHSAGKISSEDSVKMLAVDNTPSFGKRTICAFERKFSGMRDDVARI